MHPARSRGASAGVTGLHVTRRRSGTGRPAVAADGGSGDHCPNQLLQDPLSPVLDGRAVGKGRSLYPQGPCAGMVQKRPFSGNTRDLSADPDRSRVGAGLRDPRLTCWGFSSARTACTPGVPASERAAHPSATPRGFSRLDWGLHCASTSGGSGRTTATSSSPSPTAAAGRSRPAAGC